MVFVRSLLISLSVISTSLSMSENPENPQRITYLKPTPCHTLDRYSVEGNTLKVFLKREEDKICAQVITEEMLELPKDLATKINRVEVYTDQSLWRVIKR